MICLLTYRTWVFTNQRPTQKCFSIPEKLLWNGAENFPPILHLGFSGGTSGKESACQRRRHKRIKLAPSVGKIPWKMKWHPTQYSCQKNPMDRGVWQATYSPWRDKESDTTEYLSISFHPLSITSFCFSWSKRYNKAQKANGQKAEGADDGRGFSKKLCLKNQREEKKL